MSARHLAAIVVGSALLMASLSALAQQGDAPASKTPPPAVTKPAKAQAEAPATKTVQRNGKATQPTPTSTRDVPADTKPDAGCHGSLKDSDA
jgi:hypothetical protein